MQIGMETMLSTSLFFIVSVLYDDTLLYFFDTGDIIIAREGKLQGLSFRLLWSRCYGLRLPPRLLRKQPDHASIGAFAHATLGEQC